MKGPSAVATLVAFALMGSAVADISAVADSVQHRQRGLLQRSSMAAHMAPADVPVAAEVQAPVKDEGRLNLIADRFRSTYTYMAAQKVQKAFQTPHLLGPEAGEPAPTPWETFVTYLIVVFTFFLWVIIATVVAYFYHKYAEVPARDESITLDVESFKTFKHGILDCFTAPRICILATMFPSIRWAQTVSLMGFLGFWLAFGIVCGLDFLTGITGESAFLVHIVLAVLLAGFRQEMRQTFNMTRQGGFTYLEDCLAFTFCMCCTITQEARHVEEAYKAGHPAVAEVASKAKETV